MIHGGELSVLELGIRSPRISHRILDPLTNSNSSKTHHYLIDIVIVIIHGYQISIHPGSECLWHRYVQFLNLIA